MNPSPADPLPARVPSILGYVRRVLRPGIRSLSAFAAAFLIPVLCSSARALDPHQPLAQLYHTTWGPKQGVTGNVTALAQTTDGYLWLGTTDGLLRFDGITFEPYQPDTGSLPAATVSALMAVPDGGLWVGFSRGGASFIRDGQVTNYTDRDGFPVSTVRCFARDRRGAVWAAVVGGFARLEGQRWRAIDLNWNYPADSAWQLLVDREGTLWVATGSEILFLSEGEKRFQSAGIHCGPVTLLTERPDGSIVFYDESLKKLRAFRCDKDRKIEILPDIDIPANSALFDRAGALWIGSGDGLSRMPLPDRAVDYSPEKAAERFGQQQGLSGQTVESILEDREGNIWVGTDGGLDRFRHRNVTWYPLRGGPFCLVTGPDGAVWAGSRGESFPLVRVEDQKPAVDGPTDVYTSYHDPDGTTWLSGDRTLLHWQSGRFIKVPVPDEVAKLSLSSVPQGRIIASAITKDRSGSLWVAFGGSGEFRLQNGAWTFVQILPEHPDWSAGFAFTDSEDRVWLYWGDRIARYDHGQVRVFDSNDGLDVGPPNIIAERNGEIWVGGESGLTFLQGERFHTVQSAEPGAFTSITGLIATPNGDLWLSAASGIVHIPASEVDDLTRNPQLKATFELFDLVTDLPEPVQRKDDVYAPGALQASDGTLWFATRNGAVKLDPVHINRNPISPLVSIRAVTADDKTYSPFSSPALPPLAKTLRIEYAGLGLSIPERVRFRYKLEGWDKDWRDAGNRRDAFFTHLSPGDYIFRVTACNSDGVWNESGATLNLSVAPAWYQTHGLWALCVVAGFVMLWIFHRLRVRQVAKALGARFDERLAERTRIARELHDTLLQTIQGSKLVADDALDHSHDPARMRRAIEQLSGWLARATEEGREALNSLRSSTTQRNDLAEAFRRAIDECRIQSCIAPSFSVVGQAAEMHPIVRDEIYRIGYEAIRNACAHSHATQLQVELTYANDLALSVTDNGIGIDPAVADRGREGHFGLQGMRERAARIASELTVTSSANSGTAIKLVVPGGIIYRKVRSGRQRLPAKLKLILKWMGLTSDGAESDH